MSVQTVRHIQTLRTAEDTALILPEDRESDASALLIFTKDETRILCQSSYASIYYNVATFSSMCQEEKL